MNWKDTQKEVIDKLKKGQLKWLKKNVELDLKDLRKMSTGEIRKSFPGKPKDNPEGPVSTVNDARLARTLIWQNYLKIKAKQVNPLRGNLRTFWYRFSRPFMTHHQLLETDEGPFLFMDILREDLSGTEEIMEVLREIRRETKGLSKAFDRAFRGAGRELYLIDKLCKSFDQFVLRGFFRFQDEFLIQDSKEHFRIIGRKRPRYILFTEKEGMFWFCKEISKKYGITAVASHGEPGYITVEYLSDKLKARRVKNVEIAALTDYDPWGYNIAVNFGKKLAEPVFGFGVNTTHLTSLDLFTEHSIEYKYRDLSNVNPSKEKQVKDWLKLTGGIDGKPYGIHVDNAEKDRIRAAVERWYNGVSSE